MKLLSGEIHDGDTSWSTPRDGGLVFRAALVRRLGRVRLRHGVEYR